MSGFEWMFQQSLPRSCMFCECGYPVVFRKERWLDVFACGAHYLRDPKGKKVTLRLNEKRVTGSGVLYCPMMAPDDSCAQWRPIRLGGRKFKLLDEFGMFESCR